jgi:hypothetical protein
MFSKFLVGFLIAASLFSCGLKVGESVPKNDIVELKNTKCLNQAITDIKTFFDGTAEDRQVNTAFQCISQVLMAFKNNVNGVNRDFFAPEELSYFIEQNFLKGEYSFRSGFLVEIMKLKLVFLGGSSTVFYKKDIEQLSLVIDRLRPEIVKLNAEMKIVSNHWKFETLNDQEKESQFTKAKLNSLHFFEFISKEFARSGNGYEAEHFLNLIKEIAIFAKADMSTVDNIEKGRPFLIQFKKNLVGDGTLILPADWIKVSKSLNEMYFQFLRIRYFLKPLAENQREQRWVVYQKITEDVLDLISSLLDAQKKPVLTNDQVHDLVSSVLPVFSDQTIDQQLVDSFSDIKVALLGKNKTQRDQWVPNDLNLIKSKVPILFSNIRDIFGSLTNIQKLSVLGSVSYPDFNKDEITFNSSVENLMSIFDGEYNLFFAKQFLQSLDRNKLLPGFELPQKFEGLYKSVVSLKYVLTGQQGADLKNYELKHLTQFCSRTYFHYLEYSQFIKTYSFQESKIYSGLEKLLPKLKFTINKALQFKAAKFISTNELLSLYYNLQSEHIIESKFSLATVSSVLEIMWSNIFVDANHRLSGAQLQGFDSEALDTLFSEINLFIQSGHDTAAIFNQDVRLEQSEILSRIDKLLLNSISGIQIESLTELRRVIDGPLAMTLDQNKFLRIFDLNSYQVKDVFQAQVAKTLSRLLIRSFSNNPLSVQQVKGLNLGEAQYFFDSIKNLFYDLDLISPNNTTFVASRFREANLFVNHANGDDLANFEELTDLVIHIFSGLERGNVLKQQAVQACLPPQNDPVTGHTEIAEDCLLQVYFDSENGFEAIPKFSAMKKIFTEDQNKNYYLSLLKSAGHVQNPQKNVKFGDANLFPHVVQYVEIIFAKYDLNQDDFLVKDEALLAFPVFKSTIKEMLKVIPNGNKITEAQLPGVFMYLLKYGKPPKGLAEQLKFLGFINDETKWIVQSSRLDLGVIFNFIADSLAKP